MQIDCRDFIMKSIIIILSAALILAHFSGALAENLDNNRRLSAKTIKFHGNVPWKELSFQGGKGFTRIAAALRLRSSKGFRPFDLKEVFSGFMRYPLAGEDIKVLSVETTFSTLIPPQAEYTRHVWFNRKTGGALQRLRWKKGAHSWLKAYKWGDSGVSRLKLRPSGPSEVTEKPGSWTGKHRSFYPYPPGVKDCSTITEPTLLFYLLSDIDTEKSRFPLDLCVFGKKRLHRITIRLMRLKPLKISFEAYGLQGERRIEKTIKPLVFFITSSPAAEEKTDDETFSLLGLKEDIYIFLDPKTRLPVRVIGKTNRFGDIVLALTGAWLK